MPSIDKWSNDLNENPEKTVVKIGIYLLIAIAFLAALGAGIRIIFFPARQAAKIVERTLDGDNVIYNYEWFHDTYEDIQALDRKIEVAREARDKANELYGPVGEWSFDQNQEYSRLASVLQGLVSQRADVAADYNAHARMVNRSIFKDGSLPDYIDIR